MEGPLPDLLARDRVGGRGPAGCTAGGCTAGGPQLVVRFIGARQCGCLVQRDEVGGAAGATTCIDLGLGHDRQVELDTVGELGEDPPDVLAVGPSAVL
jgi:hypothetical protein